MKYNTSEIIKIKRNSENITREELAYKSQVSVSSIYRMEKGDTNVSLKNYLKVLNGLSINSRELLGYHFLMNDHSNINDLMEGIIELLNSSEIKEYTQIEIDKENQEMFLIVYQSWMMMLDTIVLKCKHF